jgi:hypothetical protein
MESINDLAFDPPPEVVNDDGLGELEPVFVDCGVGDDEATGV